MTSPTSEAPDNRRAVRRHEPLAAPCRADRDEFDRDPEAFDGASTLYHHDDLRALLAFDPDGAWRQWVASGPRDDRVPGGLARAAPRRFDPAASARPFGLNVFGPFDAISGLGTAARNVVRALEASGLPHELRPHDVDGLHARVTDAEMRRPFRYSVNLVLANADQIRRLFSLYTDGAFSDAYTIAVWAWELAHFPTRFHTSFALVDEVWANSKFEQRAIAAVSPVPVHLMPLPVPADALPDRAAARRVWGLPEDAFVALCPFDARSIERRKNPSAVIRAFRAAFGTDERRILVVKHHGGDAACVAGMEADGGLLGNVRVVSRRLPESGMHTLRGACDVVVSAHRSEGFGLNLAEFQASGRTAIATDATGSRDFLDESTGYPVRARLVPVGERVGPHGADAVWWEPDEAAFAERLREAASDLAGREARGAAALARMAAEFSPAAIGARIRARLVALGLPERRPDRIAATAALATALHVPPLAGREAIAWPARLPMIGVVPLAATRAGVVEALARQLYPFWEALLLEPAAPPPENADGRQALRGTDLRVRLVAPAPDACPCAAAVEASGGPHLLLVPEGAELPPTALLAAAEALDRDDPPDMLTLGRTEAGEPVLLLAKSLLLDGLADRGDAVVGGWPGLLRRSAARARRPACVGSPAAPVPASPRNFRFSDAGTMEAWRDCLAPLGALDLAVDEEIASADIRPVSDRLARAATGEHVVLVAAGATAPSPARLEAVLAASAAVPDGGVVAAGLFATTRRTLARIAELQAPQPNFAGAVEKIRFNVAAPPALVADMTLAEHVARIAELGLFDASHYLETHLDVAQAGCDPLRHYCEHGWREDRSPNFYFDPAWYRARHMRPEDTETDPLLHWERFRHSGVRPSGWFDPAHVRVVAELPCGCDPLRFFLEHRHARDIGPMPGFDPAFYRRRRRDLAYRPTDPFEHYLRFGSDEGMNPSASFDTRFYRTTWMRRAIPDARARNPLLHYLDVRGTNDVVTSQNAALHRAVERLLADGKRAIGLDFAWHDGLPWGIDPLRGYLTDRTLPLSFWLNFANEAIASATNAAHLADGFRACYVDPADDDDICARLAECFADPRCLRHEDRPVLAFSGGRGSALISRFAERLAGRLAAAFDLRPCPVLLP